MDLVFPVVVIFTFFIGSFVLISYHTRSMSVRRNLPAQTAYEQKHGSQACYRCGAGEQRDYGLDDQNDDKRIVACSACGKDLFQYVRSGNA